MTIKNYYDILKVEQNSDLETIKTAFRREVAIYHPENNKSEGAKSKFEDVIEAYDVLSRPEKRSAFDQILNKNQTSTEVIILEQQEEKVKAKFEELQKEVMEDIQQ